jgi:hypothetical protein
MPTTGMGFFPSGSFQVSQQREEGEESREHVPPFRDPTHRFCPKRVNGEK